MGNWQDLYLQERKHERMRLLGSSKRVKNHDGITMEIEAALLKLCAALARLNSLV